MLATIFILIITATGFFITFTSALQCYNCLGQATNCEASVLISCPSVSEFCRLQWSAETGYAAQTCAVEKDCPQPGSGLVKRQVSTSGDAGNPVIADINNCCNYDGCNCIGSQCSSSGSKLGGRWSFHQLLALLSVFYCVFHIRMA